MSATPPQTQAPLVSVAIITYNQAPFIVECLESVLAQDYDNIQIVVADDGSTDGTRDILRDFERREPDRFEIRSAEKNAGITRNSNIAHFACEGKYVAWMGGDDVMLPGKISAQVREMESDPDIALCYHDLEVFDSETGETIELFSDRVRPREGSFRDVVGYGAFNGACATMVRGERVPENGFDERLPVASDWLYWMHTLRNGGKARYIDSVLGRYRRHDNNITGGGSNVPVRNFQDHLAAVGYLLAEHPELSRQLLSRQADLLRGLRNYDGGSGYAQYLLASVRSRPNLKSILGLLMLLAGKRF